MRAPARLGLYAGALVVAFGAAYGVGGALVPSETVENWSTPATHDGGHGEGHDEGSGLSLASEGYRLEGVEAPAEPGVSEQVALTVLGPDGEAVSDFELSHDEELHLIVVRADGEHFRHVHPQRDTHGVWAIPWEWEEAGTYRIFADFVPSETGEAITLSTLVQVSGQYEPAPPADELHQAAAGDYEVSVRGDLQAGHAETLSFTVTQDGEPVTGLEPYLGAFGHLVALRDGDLGYLHVHPRGEEPQEGDSSGPEIGFEVTAPTTGRYLLYLDFQIEGQVHTAHFVLDAHALGEQYLPGTSDNGNGHDDDE